MNELPGFIIAALVFIQQEDTILLVRQSYGNQYWSLPGGVVEYGESVDQAAMREVKEETGLVVRIKRLVGVYSLPASNSIAITFEAEIIGGALALIMKFLPVNISSLTICRTPENIYASG